MDGLEQRAERAHALQLEVVRESMSIRRGWIHMAANLHAIQSEGLYELLGYDRFTDWIATPEVALKRSQVYALTQIYEELVIERNVPMEDIQYLEPSKIAEVMPAIKTGADLIEVLSDVQALTRSDLRAKYRGEEPKPSAPAERPEPGSLCPACGQVVAGAQ